MAPEVKEGKKYNFKADIYSLGIIFIDLTIPFTSMMEKSKIFEKIRLDKFPDDFQRFSEREVILYKL